MLRLERIEKLITKLKEINAKYEGIILYVIGFSKKPPFILKVVQKDLESDINGIIIQISILSGLEVSSVELKCIEWFNNTDEELVTTTALGRVIGIDGNKYLLPEFTKQGYIFSENKSFKLTEKGMKYGNYIITEDGEQFIGWYRKLVSSQLNNIKDIIKKKFYFPIYHMTHIDNLNGILKSGILSHNGVTKYKDISNTKVNNLRLESKNPLNFSLHQYVPTYFNPRNAMLYACCKEYGNDIVILEINADVIFQDYTMFSYGNAARGDSYITTDKFEVFNFNWDKIYSNSWNNDNALVKEEFKSAMMSECLVFESIGIESICKIHCRNDLIKSKVALMTKNAIKVIESKEKFF